MEVVNKYSAETSPSSSTSLCVASVAEAKLDPLWLRLEEPCSVNLITLLCRSPWTHTLVSAPPLPAPLQVGTSK